MDKDFSSFSWFLAGVVSILIVLAVMIVATPSCYAGEAQKDKTHIPTMVCQDKSGLYFISPDAVVAITMRLGHEGHCLVVVDTVGKPHQFCQGVAIESVCKPAYGTIL